MTNYCSEHEVAYEEMSGRMRCRRCVYRRNQGYRKRDYRPNNYCIDCGILMSGRRKKCDECRGRCSACRGPLSVTKGGHLYCKPCHKTRGIKYRYGVDSEGAAKLESMTNCESCGEDGSRGGKGLHIDHSHETGEVRGVLCHYCNLTLGLIQDDPKKLAALISYLKERS